MRTILLLILSQLLIIHNAYSQKTVYHEYKDLSYEFIITKWNIDEKEFGEFVLEEKIDTNNRTIELRFLKNGELNPNDGITSIPWIQYEYPSDTVVLFKRLNKDGKVIVLMDQQIPSRIKYRISKKKDSIIAEEKYLDIDKELYYKNGWDSTYLETVIKSYLDIMKNPNPLFIEGYDKAYYKLDRKMPTGSYFKLEEIDARYYEKPKEKEEVLNCIKKSK